MLKPKDDSEQVQVEVGGKTYNVTCACTDEEREQGLQNVSELGSDEGMLFIFDEPTEVGFWMKDTLIPLDIVFIDEYGEVVEVNHGQPQDEETVFEAKDIKWVLEVNLGSGIEVGDDVEIDGLDDSEEDSEEEDEEPQTMHVLDEQGDSQMELEGGERIFSRPNTVTLVRLAKRAYKSKSDNDYKRLARKVFAYINVQDNKEDDYVSIDD